MQDSNGYFTLLGPGTVLWIRVSTGQLCIEVNYGEETGLPESRAELPYFQRVTYLGIPLTSDTDLEETILSRITLDNFHYILCPNGEGYRIEIHGPGTVLLGSLAWPMPNSPNPFNPFIAISLSDRLGLSDMHQGFWQYGDAHTASPFSPKSEILPNGWTRSVSILFQPPNVTEGIHSIALASLPTSTYCHFRKRVYLTPKTRWRVRKAWLAQANYVMAKSGLDAGEAQINNTCFLNSLCSGRRMLYEVRPL
jgi:hypothetical protein